LLENRRDRIADFAEELVIGGRCFDGARLVEVLADAARRRERPVHRAHDVGDHDVRRRPSEPEPTLRAASGDDEAGGGELAQDLFEERGGDAEALDDLLPFAPLLAPFADGEEREATIFAGGGGAHRTGAFFGLLIAFVNK